ncbi:hypothetical protein RJD24_15625 [Bacillaceae bacterium IKA-2]|nr:hypothetical protein RJD24_15625 [Bacillaceae bacterium IKA-2]
MTRVSIGIATFLFFAWLAALGLNIDIYRRVNIELSIFGPIIDAVLFMSVALVIYLAVIIFNQKTANSKKWVQTSLLILGIGTLVMISFFYVATIQ